MSQKRTISNLVPGSTYITRVRAYNGLGTPSDWSEAVKFNVPQLLGGGGPDTPSNLLINFASTTLILSWTAPLVFSVDHYEISLTAAAITVVYTSGTTTFSYGETSNIADFGSMQGIIDIQIRAVDSVGNKSSPLHGIANHAGPTSPVDPPDLAASFTIITISMTTNDNAAWGGYYLESSTNGTTFTSLATLINKDTYNHQVGFGSHYWYRYKIIDKFGNLSASFSPVADISTHTALVIDGFDVITNLSIKSQLIIDPLGEIASYNYVGSSGYIITSSKITIQNGGIDILGLGGFLSMDSTSLRAVYSGNTQLLVNSSGVFIGGIDSNTAQIYVDTVASKTYIQNATIFRSAGGNYTFTVDLSNQTTGSKVLRLTDSFGVDTFYLTNDGEGYFAKGNINLGGSSALHVDNSGNLWLGHSSFGSAPFRVSAAGAVTATSGTFSANVSGAAITGGTIAIGSVDNIFKADSNGIYLGNAIFASAPFRVDMAGNLTATAATISGTINATGGTFSGTITGGTFVGSVFKTATSGQRIEVGASINTINFYSGNGSETGNGTILVDNSLVKMVLQGPHTSGTYGGELNLGSDQAFISFNNGSTLAMSWDRGFNAITAYYPLTTSGTFLQAQRDNQDSWTLMGVISRAQTNSGTYTRAGYTAYANSTAISWRLDTTTGAGWEARDSAGTGYVPIYASAFTVSSSERFKQAIQSVTVESYDKLMDINVISFERNPQSHLPEWEATEASILNESGTRFGFSAEQIAAVIPEAIGWRQTDEGAIPEGIDFTVLTALEVGKIQQQQQQIDDIISRLTALEANP